MGKRVVITVHGIRTRGAWQKQLTPVLAKHEFIPYPLDYGRFSAMSFLIPCRRESKLDWFHTEYDRICRQEQIIRPSIIAHSFGTYLTSHLLKRYPEVRFDKVIFVGSIAEEKFDWVAALRDNRVLYIRNEYAARDRWPDIAKHVISQAGNSGSKGFVGQSHPRFSQEKFDISHSGTFFDGHFDQWVAYVSQPIMSTADQKRLKNFLQVAVDITAQKLSLSNDLVRANVFVPVGDVLVIPEGAQHNMDGHPDISIRIPLGMGSTGKAFRDREVHVAIFRGHWGDDTLPTEELAKVHPKLKWIISIPLSDGRDGRVFGVMNIDGLVESKSVDMLTTAGGGQLLTDLQIKSEMVASKLCSLEQGRI